MPESREGLKNDPENDSDGDAPTDGERSQPQKRLSEKIAGEVVLSEDPGRTLRKWRENFDVSQSELSDHLDVSSSVISDYESGRRESPGIQVVRRIVDSLIEIDRERGGNTLRRYKRVLGAGFEGEAIKDLRDYETPESIEGFHEAIDAETIVEGDVETEIKGHTVINSIEAITTFSDNEFARLYGWSTQRALIFTGVTRGESPLVAIRVTNLKPSVVVLHGLEKDEVSEVAERLAEIEGIGLSVTDMELNSMIQKLS
ncbi:MAG: helix-turn-helix domain-containing protein, partial [Halobacteria archaeon]|nr:helix-turn-helix domain-containing protein [Halobacteria archaeon]